MKSNTEMTFDQFVLNLTKLDWYYNMSDDHQAYLRGQRSVQSYRDLAIAKGGKWQEAFKAESDKHRI
jgi:hypothetical protein